MSIRLREFTLENFPIIRAYEDENNEPRFIASDVAKALGYENPSRDVQRHCKKVNKITLTTKTVGGGSQPPVTMLSIPESDLFRLIMRSNQHDAERFQTWVCEEVLPQIRKTGKYSAQSKAAPQSSHWEIDEIIRTLAGACSYPFIPGALKLELLKTCLLRAGYPCNSLK
jgi:prophage antirepressor-like protein